MMPYAQIRGRRVAVCQVGCRNASTVERCSRHRWRKCGRRHSTVAPAARCEATKLNTNPCETLSWPPAVQCGVQIAVVVPFRNQLPLQDRGVQLDRFIPYMNKFLSSIPKAKVAIIIVEQAQDKCKFNRGQLLNIGFKIAQETLPGFSSFITHDVDLLPSMDMRPVYANPPSQGAAVHLASVWPKYTYGTFIGGVLSFCPADFMRVNGYPNDYWGWGLEDDQIALRMAHHGIRSLRVKAGNYIDLDPVNMKAVLESRNADVIRNHLPWYNKEMFRKEVLHVDNDWSTNGLSNLVEWKVLSKTTDGSVHRIVVELQGTVNAHHKQPG